MRISQLDRRSVHGGVTVPILPLNDERKIADSPRNFEKFWPKSRNFAQVGETCESGKSLVKSNHSWHCLLASDLP